jgi:hypothetical protein
MDMSILQDWCKHWLIDLTFFFSNHGVNGRQRMWEPKFEKIKTRQEIVHTSPANDLNIVIWHQSRRNWARIIVWHFRRNRLPLLIRCNQLIWATSMSPSSSSHTNLACFKRLQHQTDRNSCTSLFSTEHVLTTACKPKCSWIFDRISSFTITRIVISLPNDRLLNLLIHHQSKWASKTRFRDTISIKLGRCKSKSLGFITPRHSYIYIDNANETDGTWRRRKRRGGWEVEREVVQAQHVPPGYIVKPPGTL